MLLMFFLKLTRMLQLVTKLVEIPVCVNSRSNVNMILRDDSDDNVAYHHHNRRLFQVKSSSVMIIAL